jgi:hypothetical protein
MKIKPQFGLEVGVSNGGYLRIAQSRPFESAEDVVLLSPNEARLLIDELQAMSDGDWWSSFEAEE